MIAKLERTLSNATPNNDQTVSTMRTLIANTKKERTTALNRIEAEATVVCVGG